MASESTRRILLISAIIAVALAARLLYQGAFFPPYYDQEESELLRNVTFLFDTAHYHQSWAKALWLTSGEYNKGFQYLVAPFYPWVGDQAALVWVGSSVGSALIAWLWVFIYLRTRGGDARLATWVWAITLTILVVCIRRMKWHPLSHFGAASVLLALAPFWWRELSRRTALQVHALGLALYALSVFLYFGNLQYLPPFLLLWFWFSPAEQRRKMVAIGAGVLVLGVAVNLYTWSSNSLWRFDVQVSFQRLLRLSHAEEWRSLGRSFLSFCNAYYTMAGLAVSAVGLGALISRMVKGCRFSTALLMVGGWSLGMQAWMWGFDYPDCLNWSVVCLTLLFVSGADLLLNTARRWHLRVGYAASGVVVALALAEFLAYPAKHRGIPTQDVAVPWHTPVQLALLFNPETSPLRPDQRPQLPGREVPVNEGGFDLRFVLLTRDVREPYLAADHFHSRTDLEKRIADSDRRHELWVVLSAASEEAFQEKIAGVLPERLDLGKEIFGHAYPVRSYRFPAPVLRP